MYAYTHTREEARGQEWADTKFQEIADKYKEALETMQNEQQEAGEELMPINDRDVYLQVVKGKKKQRIIGLGSSASSFYPDKYVNSQPRETQPSTNIDSLVNDSVKRVMEEMMREMEVREIALKAEQKEFQKKIEAEEEEFRLRREAEEEEFQKIKKEEEDELKQKKEALNVELQEMLAAHMESEFRKFLSSKMFNLDVTKR